MKKPTIALLGERGPEAVIPLKMPTMPPLAFAGGGSAPLVQGKTEIHNHFHAGAMMANEPEARQFARLIHKYLREEVATRTVGITI